VKQMGSKEGRNMKNVFLINGKGKGEIVPVLN
jgi:hypothetical protein